MKFVDAAPISGTRKTDRGLVADAVVARTGIQLYNGDEVGRPDMAIVRVWRSEDEVSNPASVMSYSHAPVTMDHPEQMVTQDNWKDLAKGEMGEDAKWEDGKLRIPLIVKDADAIASIEAGKRELSAGYSCDLDWTAGTTPNGQVFDAQQRNIRINHVAIVDRGRAGVAKIGDTKPWGVSPVLKSATEAAMTDKLTTFVAFDEAHELTSDGVKLAKRYEKALDEAKTQAKDAADKAAKDIEAKDAEISKLTAAKDVLEKQAKDAKLSPADLTKLMADRKVVVDKAVALGLDAKKSEDMSEEEMKAEVVKKKMGDKAADYTADQMTVAFDMLQADPLKDGITTPPQHDKDLDDAYAKRDAALSDAWKGKKEGEAA